MKKNGPVSERSRFVLGADRKQLVPCRSPANGQGFKTGSNVHFRGWTIAYQKTFQSLLKNTPMAGIEGMGMPCPALSPNTHLTKLGGIVSDGM